MPMGTVLATTSAIIAGIKLHQARALKTPFRVLWYAECCGLTQTTNIDGKEDFREVSLRDILDMINKQQRAEGQENLSASPPFTTACLLLHVSCNKPLASSCWLIATTRPSSCCLSIGLLSSSPACVPTTSGCSRKVNDNMAFR